LSIIETVLRKVKKRNRVRGEKKREEERKRMKR
jgi:hypothetical protein